MGHLFDAGHDVVVLDDAYQHRALKPGFTVLLFDYASLPGPKWLLPAGNYRDAFQERRRADIIVVTKVPAGTSDHEKARALGLLGTERGTPVLYAGIEYDDPVPLTSEVPAMLSVQADASPFRGGVVLLLTGIANPDPLRRYLAAHADAVVPMAFSDHHRYTGADLGNVVSRFHALSGTRKWIVTTEKDAQRLLDPQLMGALAGLPIYFLPIRMRFDGHDGSFSTNASWIM